MESSLSLKLTRASAIRSDEPKNTSKRSQVRVLGAVLDQRTFPIPRVPVREALARCKSERQALVRIADD